MNHFIAFGLGVAIGLIAFVAFAVLLAYRDGHPFGDTVRVDDPPTLLDGWHGRDDP